MHHRWKMQVLRPPARVRRGEKHKYEIAGMEYASIKKHKTHNVYIQFVEIVMELSLIMEGN